MEVWAAIDLLEGKVVRLVKGDVSSTIVYSNNPLHVAGRLTALGFDGLHIVDLDAALGIGSNLEIIKEIVKSVDIKTQVGGGVRKREFIEELLGLGVCRVVIGTLIFKDHELVARLVKEYGPEHLVAALDHYRDRIVYRGWMKSSDMRLNEGYSLVRELGIKYVLTTSVERDGTLTGPDLQTLASLNPENRAMTYASGGIASPSELREIATLGLRGAILGRTLYEGLIPPTEFIKAAREK